MPIGRTKISNRQSNFKSEGTKRKQTNAKLNRGKEITKVILKINEINTKKTIENISETKKKKVKLRAGVFNKMIKIDKLLAKLRKRKRT